VPVSNNGGGERKKEHKDWRNNHNNGNKHHHHENNNHHHHDNHHHQHGQEPELPNAGRREKEPAFDETQVLPVHNLHALALSFSCMFFVMRSAGRREKEPPLKEWQVLPGAEAAWPCCEAFMPGSLLADRCCSCSGAFLQVHPAYSCTRTVQGTSTVQS
jgi:hypothetical protein